MLFCQIINTINCMVYRRALLECEGDQDQEIYSKEPVNVWSNDLGQVCTPRGPAETRKCPLSSDATDRIVRVEAELSED